MARLIDADALIDNAREMVFEDINATGYGYSWDAVTVTDIMNAPTIEAVPVVHAEWIDGCCTNCRAYMPTDSSIDFISEDECNYCYSCGAKMRTK